MMNALSVLIDCPAKINLSLAITGRREDGFHELLSVVCPLSLCDRLEVTIVGRNSPDTLECSDPTVPCDASNLVLKAAVVLRQAIPDLPGCHFKLEKRIPHGAGLGGGSSDAAGALVGMNQLMGDRLSTAELAAIAATIGSDCPVFVDPRPRIFSGRGDILRDLPAAAVESLKGQRFLLFKPPFGVSTPWAYGAFRDQGASAWVAKAGAEEHIQNWLTDPADLSSLLFNSLQAVVFRKYLALAVLTKQIGTQFRLPMLMSGSGSTCFAVLAADSPVDDIRAVILQALGDSAFVEEVGCVGGR